MLVYKGNLRQSPTKEMYTSMDLIAGEPDGWWVRMSEENHEEVELDLSQTILFTNNPKIIATEVIAFLSFN